MNTFEKGKDRDEKIDKFLDNLAWYHSEKYTPTGLFATIGRIEGHLTTLNQNIKEANSSSEALSKALNRITLAASVIAGLGLIWSVVSYFLNR